MRNITGCPVAGLDADELFEVQPLIDEATAFFIANREYSDLPRKHKITISTCPHQCNAPEINCIALIGAPRRRPPRLRRAGRRRALDLAAPLATTSASSCRPEEALAVLRAIVDVWRLDLKYRMSRAKARLKFMVDDFGPEAFRARVEERLGRRLEDGAVPPAPAEETDHTGIHPQKQPGLFYIGFPVYLGPDERRADDPPRRPGGELGRRHPPHPAAELHPHQHPGGAARRGRRARSRRSASRSTATAARREHRLHRRAALQLHGGRDQGASCRRSSSTWRRRSATAVDGLRLNLDGCPHACAHHWVGDIGLQGTTLRERGPARRALEAYEIYLRGGLGADAAIGRPVLRRVPATEVHLVIERLFRAYLDGRGEGERIQQFFTRQSDEELSALGSGEQEAAVVRSPARP